HPARTGLHRTLARGARTAGPGALAGAGGRVVTRPVSVGRQRPVAGLGAHAAGPHAAPAAPGKSGGACTVVDRTDVPRGAEGRHRQPRLSTHGYPAGAAAALNIALSDRH